MSRKRLSFESLSDIKEEGPNAEFHAAIEFLSPMKKSTTGREYYHGKVTDGSSSFRIAGFNTKSQAKLAAISAAKSPVHLTNCDVKKSSYDDALEVILRPTTEIEPSPRKIDVPAVTEKAKKMSISQILQAEDSVLVNLGCKVIDVAPARVVRTGRLQEVTMADLTGTIKLCCWEKNVDQLEEYSSYEFKNLLVGTFRDEKTLTMRGNSSFTLTPNKDDPTIHFEIKDEDNTEVINDARIIGTQYCNLYWGCINCGNKLDPVEYDYCKCLKCHIVQERANSEFQASCNILFAATGGHKLLKACTPVIKSLLGDSIDNQAEQSLLKIKEPMVVTYSKKDDYIKSIDVSSTH